MSNNSFVEVEVNGEIVIMKFGFNAMSDIEEHFDRGIGEIMKQEKIGFRTIRALYWAGLRWKMKGITIERVGHILEEKLDEGYTFDDLMKPIQKALQNSKLFKKKAAEGEAAAEGVDGAESKN